MFMTCHPQVSSLSSEINVAENAHKAGLSPAFGPSKIATWVSGAHMPNGGNKFAMFDIEVRMISLFVVAAVTGRTTEILHACCVQMF